MSIPGLALFYGGLVRSKNMLSVLMQVFTVFSLITVLWVAYGYSAAFTEGNAFFGTLDKLGGKISYGTDSPVEDCNPFPNIYSAVTRRDLRPDDWRDIWPELAEQQEAAR